MSRLLLILALLTAPVLAQVKTDDMEIPSLDYTLRVLDDTQTLEVEIEIGGLDRPILHLAMPEWPPGSYRIRGYGDWVDDLRVFDRDAKRELSVERIDRSTWTIDLDGARRVRATYRIKPRQRRFTNFRPDPEKRYSGMHYQGPNTFMFVPGMERGVPVTCRYELPEGWKVANGMMLTDDPMVRRAKDYDTFIDCPTIVGKFVRKGFDLGETHFDCVFWNPSDKYDWDIDAFVEIVEKITAYQGSVFGGFPFRRYVYLYTVSPFGGGGLEHLTSTSCGLSDARMKANPVNGASLTAHEFFHTWNVKRIRPIALGPFDYRRENYTKNLWVAEGWTSYYGDVTLLRTGLMTEERYLRMMAGGIAREGSKARRKEHSVTWASAHVWHPDNNRDGGPRVDYYTKGEILALLIDLKIRDVTDGKQSLDDVMQFLNRWFAEHDVGYGEDDIERACTAVSNHDFHEFFARHVDGQMDPPYEQIFKPIGLRYQALELEAALPFTSRAAKGGLQVRFLRAQGRKAGLERGDLITTIDGEAVTNADTWIQDKKPGTKVTLSVIRGDNPVEIEVELLDLKRKRVTIEPDPEAEERASRLYQGWLTGN